MKNEELELRDLFAMVAMLAYLSSYPGGIEDSDDHIKLGTKSYKVADWMLRARRDPASK